MTKIKKLVSRGKKVANTSLQHFFSLLDLDPEMFSHLYSIPLKLGNRLDAKAFYDTYENIIYIDKDYLMGCINRFESDPSEKDILNMANTILHEMLHANRTVMINNETTSNNLDVKIDDERERYKQERKGFNTEEYDKYLYRILSGDKYQYKTYIPVRISINGNKTLNIVAYNNDSHDYDLFYNVDIGLEFLDKDFQHTVAKELDTMKYKPDKTYYSLKFTEENIELASDYYDGELIDRKPKNMSISDYNDYLDDRQFEIQKRLNTQRSLEEILTEAMSNIIMTARDDDRLKLDVVCKKVIDYPGRSEDVRAAAKIIDYAGLDMVKWFLTSAYKEYYEDYLKELFKDKYKDILSNADKLYISDNPNQMYTRNIEKIIDENKRGI